MARSESSSALKLELERAMRYGRCAYCRRPGSPEKPLTREHVIPRAKGGGRKDVRIIVPACARCNQRRGCGELVLFLLRRPRRISAFLDHLSTLSAESVRQIDLRVFAELYAAVCMLNECLDQGAAWRDHLKRLSSGRTVHRRRYAARRMVGAVEGRLDRLRERDPRPALSFPPPAERSSGVGPRLEESVDQLVSRLLGLLSLVWKVSVEELRNQIALQHRQGVARAHKELEEDGVVRLDGWRARTPRRRGRVDRRAGRPANRRSGGRAA